VDYIRAYCRLCFGFIDPARWFCSYRKLYLTQRTYIITWYSNWAGTIVKCLLDHRYTFIVKEESDMLAVPFRVTVGYREANRSYP
jgi:hypothetical protein